MSEAAAASLWARAQPGHPVAWIAPAGRVPPAPAGWRAVRVRCDGPGPPLAPLRQALARAAALRGAERPPDAAGERGLRAGLRRRLLGDAPPPRPDHALYTALVDLGRAAPGERVVLVLEGIDEADADTRAFARRITHGVPWPSAVVLGIRPEAAPACADLLGPLGEEQVFRADIPDVQPVELPTGAARRTLQAAAIAGPRFRTEMLAALLDRDPLRVLEDVQEAADLGVPIEDLGDGAFRLLPDITVEIRAGVLPSLAAAWRARLVDLLAPAVSEAAAPTDPPPAEPAQHAAPEPAAAAPHLAEMGRPVAAAERYLAAAAEAEVAGAHRQALAFARAGLSALGTSPTTPARAAVEAPLLLQAAAAAHALAGADPGPAGVDLTDALALADRAWASLSEDAPVALVAAIRAQAATICYDRGDPASLERALSELVEATRELQAAGLVRDAARLLNDQAAVWVRLGDPVRAAGLLDQSRAVFAGMGEPTPADRVEAAETLHLLARLPLHVSARAGQEAAAWVAAIDHGRDARRLYEQLGMARELARVEETLGRLLRRSGDATAAKAALDRAATWQQSHGDALGLARTAAALSDLAAETGSPREAVDLVATSIELNRRLGSGGGLRYNRAALAALGDTPATARLRTIVDQLLEHLEGTAAL